MRAPAFRRCFSSAGGTPAALSSARATTPCELDASFASLSSTVLFCGRTTTIRQDSPEIRPLHCPFSRLRPAERASVARSGGRSALSRARGLHPLRLAALLGEVGRPGGVAEALLLVAAGELEELIERAGGGVAVGAGGPLLP